jgi:pyruvate/2-oxoglutarate/acetoin dehydrogenase E1 component
VTRLFFREAIATALAEEMERDPRVILLGQDIAAHGGAYGETRGLFEKFGAKRVRNTPVAEAATIGIAAGAAAAGLRPVAFITYLDFLMLGLDPLVNFAAKLAHKSAGHLKAPMVVVTTAGAKGQGPTHAQCIEPWLMGVAGLTVVAPSTAGDAHGLLKSALRCDGPVVFVDHKKLFSRGGEVSGEAIPFGKAVLRKRGTRATVVAHSYMSVLALEAARDLDVEVIDLRSLWPIDWELLAESVRKTGRALFVEESQPVCGVGAELAFGLRERGVEAKMARLGAERVPITLDVEGSALPTVEKIDAAVRGLVEGA